VTDMPLTYGEVTFESMEHIFDRLRYHGALLRRTGDDTSTSNPNGNKNDIKREKNDLVFYDLGHGAGRPCLAAACLYPFGRVVGIEVRQRSW
jgi:hypothetical protein